MTDKARFLKKKKKKEKKIGNPNLGPKAGPILDLVGCNYRTQSSALSFSKNIIIRNGQKLHLFRGCKQTNKMPFFFRKFALKNAPMPPMSRIGPVRA